MADRGGFHVPGLEQTAPEVVHCRAVQRAFVIQHAQGTTEVIRRKQARLAEAIAQCAVKLLPQTPHPVFLRLNQMRHTIDLHRPRLNLK